MNQALEHIEPLRTHLIPVPGSPQLGVCQTCHGGCSFDYPRCFKCNEIKNRGFEIELLPISLSIHGGLLHNHLFQYKNSGHSTCQNLLAALTAVFFANHSLCIGDFDSITPVPSSKRAAPLLIAQKVMAMRDSINPTLNATTENNRHFDPGRFQVTRDVKGERILLFDDTFTSGSTIFSAYAALAEAGAVIVGPLVIGRHFRPDKDDSSKALYSWLKSRTWSEDNCARCDGERRDPDSMI